MVFLQPIINLVKQGAAAFGKRRALVAAPLVVAAMIAGIAMASSRSDPAKVETREDAATPTTRVVSTSGGVDDTLAAETDTTATEPAQADGPSADVQQEEASPAPGDQPVEQAAPAPNKLTPKTIPAPPQPPTVPAGESAKLQAATIGQATPVDLSENLVGNVPPVGWADGCRCAPLTGLGIDAPFPAGGPAVAVKVSNAPTAQPQTGLNLADLMYEEPAHGVGDASRFLAIYHSRNVDTIGAVRSARTGDLPLLAPLGRPILAYAGANPRTQFDVELREKEGWLVHTHENKDGPPQFFRVGPGRTSSNLFVSRNNLVSKYGPVAKPPYPQFAFLRDGQRNAGSKPASRVDLQVAGQRSGFIYDKPSQQWVRFQSGRPHLDKNGSQIGRSSVIVMTTAYQGSHADMSSIEAVTFPMPGRPASGQVWVLTGETVTQGTWTRAADKATFRLNDLKGRPIGLQRGPIYVGLTATIPTVT